MIRISSSLQLPVFAFTQTVNLRPVAQIEILKKITEIKMKQIVMFHQIKFNITLLLIIQLANVKANLKTLKMATPIDQSKERIHLYGQI